MPAEWLTSTTERPADAKPVPSDGQVVVVDHLTKRFGDLVAVDDLSFGVT